MSTVAKGTQRILVVDDHEVVREGLARILAGSGEPWDIQQAGSGFQALEVLHRQGADLVIADLSMPGMGGLELVRRIRSEFGRLPVLVLSMHAEDQYAMRAFKAGANGYITKDEPTEELVRAMRKVMQGGAYVSPRQAERVVLQMHGAVGVSRHAVLSDRELEVLNRLVAGQRLTDIAHDLHLSVKTVSTHKSRIHEKLNLPTLADLVRYGLENDPNAERQPA